MPKKEILETWKDLKKKITTKIYELNNLKSQLSSAESDRDYYD